MKEVRIAVLGIGSMGSSHARQLQEGRIARGRLVAVCDKDAARLQPFPSGVTRFSSSADLLKAGLADAVVVATPHYDHLPTGVAALKAGLHVLVEKPISVQKSDAEKLLAAHRSRKQVFGAMFNQRTDPLYQRMRDLVQRGELGRLQRVNWIITDWFRSDAYYGSGGWRATWRGEGGGALLNQCPHNLDLLQWLVGMPERVRAWCHLGRHHKIEVEDEVTAYLEFKQNATGVFITSTGEAPGTNRLEIVGTRATITAEGRKLRIARNQIPSDEWSRATRERFKAPPLETTEEAFESSGPQHAGILQNFVDAILDGTPLLAPAREGIHSVELANAMLLSSLTGKTVDLPLDARAYARQLAKLVKGSKK